VNIVFVAGALYAAESYCFSCNCWPLFFYFNEFQFTNQKAFLRNKKYI